LTRENVEKQDKTITQNKLEKDDRYRTYTSIQPKSIDKTGKTSRTIQTGAAKIGAVRTGAGLSVCNSIVIGMKLSLYTYMEGFSKAVPYLLSTGFQFLYFFEGVKNSKGHRQNIFQLFAKFISICNQSLQKYCLY
jgi:hypothetical protein